MTLRRACDNAALCYRGAQDKEGLPLTCRAVFIIGPDKKLKLSLNYPASVGRNMDEITRVVDALQLSARHSVASLPHAAALAAPGTVHRNLCPE